MINNIDKIFTYHPPNKGQILKYEEIREAGKFVAKTINYHCPDSPEKTLAIRKLQECVMWANASISINEAPDEE